MSELGEAQKAGKLVSVVAFLQRAFGGYPRSQWMTDVDRRAAAAYASLKPPKSEFLLEVALEQLRLELDLLTEDTAVFESGLLLHARLIELAPHLPWAAVLVRSMLQESPVAKLCTAMLAQGSADGATAVRLEFHPNRRGHVYYLLGRDWREAMTVPMSLKLPVLCFVKRAEFVGYPFMRPHLRDNAPLPESLRFDWNGESVVVMSF